jgi:hypothetical protein
MPMLTVIDFACRGPVTVPSRLTFSRRRERRRLLLVRARKQDDELIPAQPPNRPTASVRRTRSRRRPATRASAWSPTAWPNASLISLKWSTSMTRTAPCPP